MSRNPYQILHLEEDASYDEIKERYRHLTRSLHPDKQPLENYQITKKLFEQIDEAYKSISSPLRRYLFREYGLPALRILEEVPGYFEEFDVEEIGEAQAKRLKQLMIYLLYEREASYQTDKTKFVTRMVMNITKLLKGRPKNYKKGSKRNYSIPEIENCTFQYEMVLPEFLGFNNTFALSQSTTNIKTDPKHALNFVISLARRMYMSYMLAIQANVSTEQTNFAVGINRVCENNLVLNFTPISLSNWRLTAPKFSIEKSLQDYQISTSFDLSGGVNVEYSESTSKRVGKSLKLYMENGSLGVIPKVEIQMTDFLRFFVQVSAGIESHGKDGINIRPSLTYGYRLKVNDELKLELSSSIGVSNYLQLSFISSKFRVGIPLITAEVDLARFQFLKVIAMVLVYGGVQGYKYRNRRNAHLKQRLLRENETRLVELKRELNRTLSDIELSAQVKREKEIKYRGLVIVRAIFGEERKVKDIAGKLKKLKFRWEEGFFDRDVADLQLAIIGLNLPVGGIEDEAENITTLIQNEVMGGQLINFNLEHLKRYNPSIDPDSTPLLSLLYIERGQLKHLQAKCNHRINLGTKPSPFLSSLFRAALGYLIY